MYESRRNALMKKMENGVAILKAGSRKPRGRYKYRQDSSFYYFTGFEEPDAICLLTPEHDEHSFVMFVNPKDSDKEVWTGKRTGVEGVVEKFHADAAFEVDEFDEKNSDYLEEVDRIYYSMGTDEKFDKKIIEIFKNYSSQRASKGKAPNTLVDLRELIGEMRIKKDKKEIELLRKAADISAEAHIEAMKTVEPGMYEYEVEALINSIFRESNAYMPAYPTIVGSGENGTVLHYDQNRCQIKDGELVLIDAGCEYKYYCSDITRTIPANGKFTLLQKEIYQIVLDAQLAAIGMIKPGLKFNEPHKKAIEIITSGLVELGLLEGDVKKIIEEKEYRKFYMHGTSHFLGMEPHDVGKYKIDGDESRELESGMVFTMEPGIYIGTELEDVDGKYRGIGIRIEDNILVTENGYEVLTARVPKTVDEIESVMNC